MLILMHKGKGGGLSDMFGGGMSSSLGGSTVAERNLDRFTIAISIVWCSSSLGLVAARRLLAPVRRPDRRPRGSI